MPRLVLHSDRRQRRPTLASALKQAAKAGTPVRRATIEADGAVTIVVGQPEPTEATNPWLADLDKVSKQ
jgi:hypothetical protein